MKLCGIYLLTHTATGRKYVGQSTDIKKRWSQHALGLCKMRLGRTIATYGWSAFTSEILEICDPEKLNDAECKWITEHDCISPKGLNLTGGGRNNTNVSLETRLALSKARMGAVTSESTKQKLRVAGLNRSDEYKAKISKANQARIYTPDLIEKLSSGNKGRHFSDLHRARISAAGLDRPPTTLGMKHTDEARAKMSASQTGRKQSQEAISKSAAARTGLTRSAESKAKMSASRTGKKQTPEHTANAVASRKANRLLRDISATPT